MDCILLFYRRPRSGSGIPNQPGVAVTGRLDAQGNYTDLATYDGFDYWHDIVPVDTTTGRVLFHQPGSLKTVGEVGADGGYSDVKNSTGAPSPFRFFSMRDGILMSYSTTGSQVVVAITQTWKLASNGDFDVLSEPRLLDPWVHIVPTVNGLVLFYGANTATAATAATGLITPEGAFRDLKSLEGFDQWSHVVSTSDGILLFYNQGTGAAVTGKIVDAEGNYADLQNVTLDRGWHQIVPTTNGLLLFYRATPGSAPEAVVGRINPSTGVYGDVSLVKGLERWDKIVCVRALNTIRKKKRPKISGRRKA